VDRLRPDGRWVRATAPEGDVACQGEDEVFRDQRARRLPAEIMQLPLEYRETRTIPAGAIGNERPIDIVMERWYSDELEADVLRRNIDPRFGETTYQLVNVVLGEPSPDLFVVPESYELNTEKNARFELKLQHPEGSAAP
jgi:hypothetical protein